MKTTFLVTALTALAKPAVAHACSPLSPPIAKTVEEIAASGVLIRGRLIQAFDPDKETPEIIAVDEIYVGDESPKAIVIYHPKFDFENARILRAQRRRRDAPPIVCELFDRHEVEVGKVFDRLALMPAPLKSDSAAAGRWVFHFWNGNVSRERGLDLLLKSADQHKRLRSRPRRDGAENCQECAPAGQ